MNAILFYLSVLVLLVFLVVQALLTTGKFLNNNALQFYGRSTASVAILSICALYGTIASAFLNVTGYGGLGQWTTARSFKWSMWFTAGIWFDVTDEKDYLNRTRPAVFVGNHQSELDVVFLGHVFPKYCSVTAKSSLKWVPFLGWFMAMSKTVFIQRASREQAVAAFAHAAKQMHSIGQSVYIFPEGTRSYAEKPELLPFKKGAFHLAVQAQVPIVPIVVANYSNVVNFKRKIFRPGNIPIQVLPPIETKGKTKEDVDALLAEVQEKMAVALKKLQSIPTDATSAIHQTKHTVPNGGAKSTGIDTGKRART